MAKKNRMGRLGRSAGFFALGAAAGSAIALLFAPTSGRVLRKKLAGRARNLGRSTNRQIQQAKRMLLKRAGSLQRTAADKLEDTREWIVERMAPNGNGKRHGLPRRTAHHA